MKEINIEDQLKELDRGYYDFFNEFEYADITEKGINADIVNEISDKKNEPDWMRRRRLKSLALYEKIDNPSWGPDLSELNMNDITTYVKPKSDKNLTGKPFLMISEILLIGSVFHKLNKNLWQEWVLSMIVRKFTILSKNTSLTKGLSLWIFLQLLGSMKIL